MRRLLGGVLLGVAWLAAAPARPAGADREAAQQLDKLRRAIEEQRARVGGFERQERSLLETVEAMDRAYESRSREARRARARAQEAREGLRKLEQDAQRLEVRLEATRRALARRAVALYKSGEPGPLAILFTAESLPDLLGRLEALRLLLAHDRRLIERFRAEAAHLEQAQVETERMTRVRDRASAQLAELTRQLARERAAKRALLTEAREDRSRERAALYELEAAARTLEETLTRLGDAPEPRRVSGAASTFESLRGRLEPPVKARVAGSFGRVVDSEFRTETFRKGVDFAAEEGAEVRAVADGAVRFAGWFRGYGKLVILDHGDRYFSVSGHLGEIGVERGDRVEAGDRIGSVGETGSLSGPRLYFEIRRGGAPLDPGEWLSNREPR